MIVYVTKHTFVNKVYLTARK